MFKAAFGFTEDLYTYNGGLSMKLRKSNAQVCKGLQCVNDG